MGVDKMKPGKKLREGRVALGEVKGKVEALLREKEYAKVVEEIDAFSNGYTPEEKDVEWAELQVRLAFAKEKLGRYDKETAEVAYEVLKLTDRHKEIGTIERILGRVYLVLGETKTALRYLRNSLAEFDRMEDEKGKVDTLNALGRACFISSRTQAAIEHLSEALKLCKEGVNKGDKSQGAMVLGNLGTVYRRVGDWSKAENCLRSNLKLCEEVNNTLFISHGCLSLARLLAMQRSFTECKELLDRAEALSQDFPRELSMVYESLGSLEIGIAQKDGNSHHLELAEEWLLKALQIGQRIAPEGDIICEVSEKLGWVCLGLDRLDGALGYAERSLRIAKPCMI
jgi:tetratricopeptide (TPR) repeat protein